MTWVINGKMFKHRFYVMHKGLPAPYATIAANSIDEARALIPRVAEEFDVGPWDLMIGDEVEKYDA